MFANGKLADEADEASRLPSHENSRIPSRCNSASWMMTGTGSRNGSHVYPHAPSPLHFTQLNSPKPSMFMASPALPHKARHRRRSFCTSCCCCSVFAALCSVLLTAVFLLGITALVAWLILRPIHAPRYSIDTLEFTSLHVSHETLNADGAYTITANNPNRKLGFKYDAVDIEISYRSQIFARSALGAFYQGHPNVTTLKSRVFVENFSFTPARIGSDFSADIHSGSVALRVRGSAKVRVKVGIITSFAVKVFVNCDIVMKPPASGDPSSVISKTCELTR